MNEVCGWTIVCDRSWTGSHLGYEIIHDTGIGTDLGLDVHCIIRMVYITVQ